MKMRIKLLTGEKRIGVHVKNCFKKRVKLHYIFITYGGIRFESRGIEKEQKIGI